MPTTPYYVTTQQQRQCLALRSLRQPPTYRDIRTHHTVGEEWFANGGADWNEDDLIKVLWWDHMWQLERGKQS